MIRVIDKEGDGTMEDNEDVTSAAAAFGAFDPAPVPADTVTPVDVDMLDGCGFLLSPIDPWAHAELAMCA